jgi:hypothetical protein
MGSKVIFVAEHNWQELNSMKLFHADDDILWKSYYLIRRWMHYRREILKREGSAPLVEAFNVEMYVSL